MTNTIRHGAGGGGSQGDAPVTKAITLRTDDTVELNLAISVGPIAGLIRGGQTFYLGDTPLMAPNGSNNFNPFELSVYHGSDTPSEIRNVLGGVSSNTQVGVPLVQDTPVTRVTPSGLNNNIDVIELRFYISNLMTTNAKGDRLYNTLKLKIEMRQVGDLEWYDMFPGRPVIEITGRIAGAVKEIARQVPRINNDWEIRVTKLNPDNNDLIFADVSWESFQSTTSENRSYNNLAVVRALSSASEQLNGIPQFSGVYAGRVIKVPTNYNPVTRYYDGVWDGSFKDAYTDNPAWCLYDLLTNASYGARAHYPQLLVDRFSFYTGGQWCDGLVPRPGGGYQPRYTYNDLIDQPRSGLQTIHYIAGMFGGILTRDAGGTVVLKVDKPGVPKQIFGPESISSDGFSYQYSDVETRPNQLTVTFVNPDLQWAEDMRLVTIDEYITRNGRNAEDFVAVGCIDVFEAQRRAHLRLLQANTEVVVASFRTARQAILLDSFDIVGLVDPDMNWGVSGRIKSVAGSSILLRDELFLPVGMDIEMMVQSPSGVTTLTVRSATAYTKTLTITAGSLPVDLPDRAQFSLAESSIGLVKPFRVLNIVEDDTDPDYAMVTAVEINTLKYSDADLLESSGSATYGSEALVVNLPKDIRVTSGTGELIRHTDGTIESRIRVEWTQTPAGRVDLFYRRLNMEEFQRVASLQNQVMIPNVQDGADYVIELQTYDPNGLPGPRTVPIVHRVVGKTALPEAVTGLTASGALGSIRASWDINKEVDFSHHDLVVRETLETLTDETIPDYSVDSNQFVSSGLPEATTQFFWVRSVDSTGNTSPWSNPVTATSALLANAGDPPVLVTDFVVSTLLLGSGQSLIEATWFDSGMPNYELGVTRAGGNEVVYPTGIASHDLIVIANTSYSLRVRSVNIVGTKSAWSTPQVIVSAKDVTPPATPVGLSALGGVGVAFLKWTKNTEGDLAYYEIYQSLTNTPPTAGTSGTYQTGGSFTSISSLEGGETYFFWIRAVDNSENPSAWSAAVSTTVEGINLTFTVPGVPTGLGLSSVLMSDGGVKFTATWNAAADATGYEIRLREGLGNWISFPTSELQYEWPTLPGVDFEAQVRALNTTVSSAYSTSVLHTTLIDTGAPAVPTGLAVSPGFGNLWLAWTRNLDSDLSHYEVYESATTTAPLAGTAATFVTQTNQLVREGLGDASVTRHYWVRAVDVSGNKSAWTARLAGTTTLITTNGLGTGVITAAKLSTGELITLSAQIKNAIITDAKIANLSAAKLTAGTALAGTITVSGTALSTVAANALDPAARVNAAITKIDPGKILISGASTLASWQKAGDATKIDGGAISANTIEANKLTIGDRGISITGLTFEHNSPGVDQVSWTAGALSYVNDAGVLTTVTLTASNTTWTSGILYLYWTQGGTTLSASTTLATAMGANKVVLASYQGGTKLNSNYGKTIVDGADIKTGTITADVIAANAVTADKLAANSVTAGKIASNSITATQLAAGSVTANAIAAGSLSADDIQAGKLNAQFLEVTQSLVVDAQNAGFAMGKVTAVDQSGDGLYMGRTVDPKDDTPGVFDPLLTIPAQASFVWVQQTMDVSAYIGRQARLVLKSVAYNNQTGDILLDDFDIGGTVLDPDNGVQGFESCLQLAPVSTPYEDLSAWSPTNYPFWSSAYFKWVSGGMGVPANTGSAAIWLDGSTCSFAPEGVGIWMRSPVVTITTATVSFWIRQYDAVGQMPPAVECFLDVLPLAHPGETQTGFGFLMGGVKNELPQYMQYTSTDGLEIVNANFKIIGTQLTAGVTPAADGEVDIDPAIETLSFNLLGGGGAGSSPQNALSHGQTTTVSLYDGTTLIQTWTAAGGLGNGSGGTTGQSSPYGVGGRGWYQVYSHTVNTGGGESEDVYTQYPAANGGLGAGGGADGRFSGQRGGAAGAFISVVDYDISALVAPKLVWTIGAGGIHHTGYTYAANGGKGRVEYSTNAMVASLSAGVLATRPSAGGTFSLASGFPDLGAGMWVLQCPAAVTVTVDDSGGSVSCIGSTSFIANQKPVRTAGATTGTFTYSFYPMSGDI